MAKTPQDIQNEEKTQVALEAPVVLQEWQLSWAGKIFFAGAASYITGTGLSKVRMPLKIRGTPAQMKAVVDAIVGSKEFQREITKPGATIDSVIQKMNLRNMTKQRFQDITGKAFPI
jgi:hypothetical protein